MQHKPFIAKSEKKIARHKNGKGYFARVSLTVEYPSTSPNVDFCCSGCGFFSQGYVEEATAEGYDDWKAGAKVGVNFALSIAEMSNCQVVITKIEGLDATDTNPTIVGAAAALATWSALKFEPQKEAIDKLEMLVFKSWEQAHDEIPIFTNN
jgi:hypothetical protein